MIEKEDSDVAYDVEQHLNEVFRDMEARWRDEVKRAVVKAYFLYVTPWCRENGVEFFGRAVQGAEIEWPDGQAAGSYDVEKLERELARIRGELPKLAHLTEDRVRRAKVGTEALQIEAAFRNARLRFPNALQLLGEFLKEEYQKTQKVRSGGVPVNCVERS